MVAAAWAAVLGRDRVGRDENFFDLGGSSLLLVSAQSAVNEALGSDLTTVDLFAHPTVADLAGHLAARGTAAPGAPPERREVREAGEDGEGAATAQDRARQRVARRQAAQAARRATAARRDDGSDG